MLFAQVKFFAGHGHVQSFRLDLHLKLFFFHFLLGGGDGLFQFSPNLVG